MWLTTCAPRLSRRLGHQGQVLTGGAMPAPGPRPASAALRGRGLAHATAFQQSPRGVTRALWSRLAGARLWRLLLVPTPAPRGPLGLGGEAPPGGAQSGPRPRPCAGARCSPPPGQRAWGAGGAPAALGSRALGQARLGLAVRDGPRARRARAAGPRHQELTAWARQRPRVVRRGRPARALGGGPERSVAGLARRWRRRQGAPPLGRDACAAGGRPRRARSPAGASADWPPPPARPAPAARGPRAAGCGHRVAHRPGAPRGERGGTAGGERVGPGGAGDARPVRAPGVAGHRPHRGPQPAPGVVWAAAASGRDGAGGPGPPRRGAPPSGAGAGPGPHAPGAVGPVLARHADGRTMGARASAAGQASRVGPQLAAARRRGHRHGAPARVGLDALVPVTGESRPGGNPLRAADPCARAPLLCRVMDKVEL